MLNNEKKQKVFSACYFAFQIFISFSTLIFLLQASFQVMLKDLRPCPSEVNTFIHTVSSTAWLYSPHPKES